MPTTITIRPERFALAQAEKAHPKAFASITNLDSITVVIEENLADICQEKMLGWKLCSFINSTESLSEKIKTALRTAIPCLWLCVNGREHVLVQEIHLPTAYNLFSSWNWEISM